jgi:arylsulfatase
MGIVEERWPLTERDEDAPAWEDTEHKEWQARRMEVYAAQVDALDRAIGRIMASLREAGLFDDTLVLFLADNGGCAEELSSASWGLHIPAETRDGQPVMVGNNPEVMPGPEDTYQSYGLPWANASNTPFRRYKHWVHEGGIATPLIAHWPARVKQAGALTHQPGHLIDLMATCLDVAGAEYPAAFNGNDITALEGKTLTPIFDGGERDGHEAIYWEHEGNRAVRQGQWKLVSRYEHETGGEWELYDLDADRTETHDLVDEQPAKAAELVGLYEQWAERSLVVLWRSWELPA